MKGRILALAVALCLLLGGCGEGSAPVEKPAPSASPEELGLYESLFSMENQIRLELSMSDAELAKMQADHDRYTACGSKSPIYRMADLKVTITTPEGQAKSYTLEQVGVRMKGNTSRTSFYSEQEGIYNLIHLKISFQETFDDPQYYGSDALSWSEEARMARKDRTFATLEKIDLKWNRCDDSTYIKESYAYTLYRENGVLAPRTNLASLDWAGVHAGVYTLYEPVDKLFLEKRLPESQLGGDLYKCGWTNEGASFTNLSSVGIEDEDAGKFYIYDLKTNKKTSQHEALTRFITGLNSGSLTKEGVAELVDIDNFLRYAAVSWFLGNPDDLRNNYNNFYLYFRPDGKALLIPYDYDRCLGVTRDYNPSGHGMTADSPFCLEALGHGGKQKNPLYLYTVCQGGYYTGEFAQCLQELSQSRWLTLDAFRDVFGLAVKNYQYLTSPGKEFHNAGGHSFSLELYKTSDFGSQGNISFSEYIAAKQATLASALKSLDTTADPQVPADLYIRAEFTDWAVKDGYALKQVGDVWEYTVSGSGKLLFKVYQVSRDEWYGAESLTEDTAVSWQTDDHGNIILPAGTYLVHFDPETLTIFIERK